MSRWEDEWADWDDDPDDEDFVDEWEPDADEESDVVPCPNCGADVYEDAVRCPLCGEYITRQSATPWEGKPLWWVLLAVLGIIAVILTLSVM